MNEESHAAHAAHRERNLPPVAPPGVRQLCLALLIVMTSAHAFYGAASVGNRAADFEYFYKASRWLLEHGNIDARYDLLPDGTRVPRGGIEWYLPFVPRVYTAISWMPMRLAGTLWLLTNIVVFFGILRLLGRYLSGLPPQDWMVTQLLPVFFLALFWHWEFRLNQINALTLLLLLGGFVQWQQGRKVLPGVWLGLAVLLKLTPLLVVVWFALKREFRVVAVALGVFIVAGPLADVVVFRPDYVGEVYRNWVHHAIERGSHTGLILDQREMDWRNQGLGAVLSRWLHPTDYNTHFDNDPRIRYAHDPRYLNLVHLPRETIVVIVTAIAALSGLGLLWIARRPAAQCSAWQLRLEWALFVMAMLWFMPVMRRYHLVWMLPAVSLLAACVHHLTPQARWSRLATAAVLVVFVAQVSVISRMIWDTHIVEASGAFLALLPVVALPIVILIVRLARRPDLLPEDPFVHSVPAGRTQRRRLPRETLPAAAPAHA